MKASTVICVGDIIRWRRKKKGWTQKKLAEESGIHEVQIRRYESNKSLPRDAQLQKIAKALNLEKDYFEDIPQRTAEMNAAVFTTPDGNTTVRPFTAPQGNPSGHPTVEQMQILREATRQILAEENAKRASNNLMQKPNPKELLESPNEVYEETNTKLSEIGTNKQTELNLKYIYRKINTGEDLTLDEEEFLKKQTLKQLGPSLEKFYSKLNREGQKKADEQIDRLIEQMVLLTKIPEYQKEPEQKTAAPEREPQDGETDTQ